MLYFPLSRRPTNFNGRSKDKAENASKKKNSETFGAKERTDENDKSQ